MKYWLFGIGNALVDMEYAVDEVFLRDQGLDKGHMTLVDEDRLGALRATLGERRHRRMSGGSAANTVFALHAFGGSGFYACRVAEDDAGRHFLADLAAAGIVSGGSHAAPGSSGTCLTLVTADAERTMATCLGVSGALAPNDVDEAAVANSEYYYAEGYLAASASGSAAAVRGREIAEEASVRTSLSLSDPSMVAGCRDGLEQMLGNGVHQLFCNEEEALGWAGTDRLDVALQELRDIAPFVNVTLGANGSLAVSGREVLHAQGIEASAVDTTGAGDIYAGAFLFARISGAEPLPAARFANFASADLVARHGARLPSVRDYADLKRRFV